MPGAGLLRQNARELYAMRQLKVIPGDLLLLLGDMGVDHIGWSSREQRRLNLARFRIHPAGHRREAGIRRDNRRFRIQQERDRPTLGAIHRHLALSEVLHHFAELEGLAPGRLQVEDILPGEEHRRIDRRLGIKERIELAVEEIDAAREAEVNHVIEEDIVGCAIAIVEAVEFIVRSCEEFADFRQLVPGRWHGQLAPVGFHESRLLVGVIEEIGAVGEHAYSHQRRNADPFLFRHRHGAESAGGEVFRM